MKKLITFFTVLSIFSLGSLSAKEHGQAAAAGRSNAPWIAAGIGTVVIAAVATAVAVTTGKTHHETVSTHTHS